MTRRLGMQAAHRVGELQESRFGGIRGGRRRLVWNRRNGCVASPTSGGPCLAFCSVRDGRHSRPRGGPTKIFPPPLAGEVSWVEQRDLNPRVLRSKPPPPTDVSIP